MMHEKIQLISIQNAKVLNPDMQGWIQQDLVGGVHQSRVGVDQRYKYMGLGVDHGAGHHRPCDHTSNVQRSAA